ncbi:MAG: hypothetical protein JWN34_860 [Bryobacterales bacterium]|nr:hypothetical protein [Bryobacterales bacterium]
MGKFGEMNALAAGGNYQALVCIYLGGGNDGHNTVVPITTAQQSYSLYKNGRGAVALPQASLLTINNGNDVYGLHPKLTEIRNIYQQGKAAVVANVGMLLKPLDRNLYNTNNSAIIPNSLFSHSDQTNQWHTSDPSGLGSAGWGGRVNDLVQSLNTGATFPSMASMAGSSLFVTGNQTFAASVPAGGAGLLQAGNQQRAQGLQQLLQFDNGLQLVQAANSTMSRGVSYASALNSALQGVTLATVFPAGLLAAQLQTVAKIIKVRGTLGLSRQVFFCSLGGFDTHGGQLATQDALLGELSKAVGAFYAATQELAVDNAVTTFTASEFGRTLTPNGNGGTDHAWGSHHFVIGGAVQGGQFYGQFPVLALGNETDANSRGTLIPTTSVDQYGATMARWFGVDPAGVADIFKNQANFSNLTFLG